MRSFVTTTLEAFLETAKSGNLIHEAQRHWLSWPQISYYLRDRVVSLYQNFVSCDNRPNIQVIGVTVKLFSGRSIAGTGAVVL